MKLSKEARKKHRWLLKELRAISKELEEMEKKSARVSDGTRGEGREAEDS